MHMDSYYFLSLFYSINLFFLSLKLFDLLEEGGCYEYSISIGHT